MLVGIGLARLLMQAKAPAGGAVPTASREA
jgi:hypothetical protein